MRSYKRFAVIDFETYFDQEYSLRNKLVSTTSYIRDDRFKTQCMGIQFDTWATPKVYKGSDIQHVLNDIDPTDLGIVCHHTNFDGLILTHHYNFHPAFWLDTMAMSALIYGVDARHSLDHLTRRLGREAKTRAEALENVKGTRDLTPELLRLLAEYCGEDVHHTMLNFRMLLPAVPEDELRIIDMTIRMYVEPVLDLNDHKVAEILHKEVNKKNDAFEKVPVVVSGKGGQQRFISQLQSYGVEIPMKNSPTAAKRGEFLPVPALSKGDLEFKALMLHPDERVRDLVEARVRSKSAQIETRSRRMLGYAGWPLPIYLKYWAARTGRWGGGDRVNWQNLPRRGDGAQLRKALRAPKGHLLVVSDASQIEARLNAWDAGQLDLLETFASGRDVYIMTAALIWGIPYEEVTDEQRFVGKVFVLGGGYGAGAPKINYMFKLGQFGPPLDMPLEQTEELLTQWRRANSRIVQKWKTNEKDAYNAFINQTTVLSGCVTYEGRHGDGFMHAPNGTYLRYGQVSYDYEGRQMSYSAKTGQVKLYGGILTENRIQKLARHVLAEQLLVMDTEMPDARVAALVHDEVILVVPECRAESYAGLVKQIMSTTPAWAQGLPLNAETKIYSFYDKS